MIDALCIVSHLDDGVESEVWGWWRSKEELRHFEVVFCNVGIPMVDVANKIEPARSAAKTPHYVVCGRVGMRGSGVGGRTEIVGHGDREVCVFARGSSAYQVPSIHMKRLLPAASRSRKLGAGGFSVILKAEPGKNRVKCEEGITLLGSRGWRGDREAHGA